MLVEILEVAMNTAYEIGDDECWHRLGMEALRQGNHQVVEMSYQRTKEFRAAFFSLSIDWEYRETS